MPATATKTCPRNLELTTRLEIQAADGSKGPPRFTMIANSGEPMPNLEGFMDPVIIDLAGAKFDKDPTPVIADHDTTKRIGHTTAQRIDANGIYAEGVVSSGMGIAQGFVEDAKAGFPFQVSVGAKIVKATFVPEGQTIEVNGKEWSGPLIVARETIVRELSITVLGADSKTSALVAARSKSNPLERIETMPTTNTHDPVAIERERISTINSFLKPPANGGWSNVQTEVEHIRASAINGDISLSDLPAHVKDLTELQNVRTSYPEMSSGPAIHARGGRVPMDNRVLEAALVNHVGLDLMKAGYDEQTAEAGRQLGVTCLMDVAKLCCQMTGRDVDFRSKDAVIKAAFSSAVFTDLLSNAANKSTLDAYNAFPSAARMIAKKLDANDFKQHTGIRLTGDATMLKVAGDGEIKHGTLADQSYTYAVDTYARMFGIDRKTIVNDDLSALDDTPRLIGRGAALALEEVFWTLVLANTGNFFHADNRNLLTGAGSALDGDSLSAAVQKFLEQTDTQNKPIGVTPRWLVVPPALKAKADELFTSRLFNSSGGSSTDSDRVTTANAFFGLYEPAAAPWLGDNGGLASGSDSGWYLFGDARDVPAFGIAYLDGIDRPTIEEFEQAPNKLGAGFRGWFDFGVCQIDHRGAVKSDGV